MKFLTVLPVLAMTACATGARYSLDAPEDASKYAGQTVEIRGTSMVPLAYPGDELTLLEGYYKDNPAKRHDLVAYRYAGRQNPLMKAVYGVPGDNWEIEESDYFCRILVNGKALKNSAGKEYRIPKDSSKRLKLYAGSYPVIPEDTYLILGNDPKGGLDSVTFGLVHRQDIAGRLVRLRESDAESRGLDKN